MVCLIKNKEVKMEKKVLKIVNNILERNDIDDKYLETNLSELGIDSIKFIRLIISLEDVFAIEIPEDYLLIEKLINVKNILCVIETLL